MQHHAIGTPGSSSPSRSFLLTVVATCWWIAHLWKENYAEFSSSDIVVFLVHGACVLLIEYLLLIVITRFLSARWSPLANALFCTLNGYTTILIHSEQVATLSIVLTVALLLVCVVVFLVVFLAVRGNPFVFGVAISVVLLLTATNLGRYAFKAWKQQQAMAAAALPSRLTFPTFTERPNVYFVFFDAMIPQAIARRFLKIDDELEYVRTIRDANMRILKNVFADYVPTLPAVSAFVAVDLDYFEGIEAPTRYLQVIGTIPGPLYEIFKRNGYKTQLIYETNYFGRPNRAKLDYYGIVHDRSVCHHVDSKHALLGYCLPEVGSFWAKIFHTRVLDQRYPEMLFERIAETAASSDPWLTIAYIKSPKHTLKTFNYYEPQHWEAYAKKFEEVGVPRAARNLRDLLKTLDMHDPGSVVVVLGDHGAWLSRGLSLEKGTPQNGPLDTSEVFLDRHAVLGAVLPATFCPDYFQGPIGLAQIARDVIKCLANGQDPLPGDYRPYANRYRQHAYE